MSIHQNIYYHPKHWFQELEKTKRDSISYSKWRRHIKVRDGERCVKCGSTEELHVHHRMRYSEHIFARLRKDNGIVLCKDCHAKEHPWMGGKRDHILRKKGDRNG